MKRERRRVVFQPAVYDSLQRGVNYIVSAIQPTLGPLPRFVAIERLRDRSPELLDNGAVIARRIIQLPDRDADIGAMLVRHMLWRLYEKVGDGTATAAVLFQSIFNQSLSTLAAGGNLLQLQHYLRRGLQLICTRLDGLVIHLEGQEALAHIAQTICHEAEMAQMLAEIIDIVGPYGQVDIRTGSSRTPEREYLDGLYWAGGLLDRTVEIDPKQSRVELDNAALVMTDLSIDEPRQLACVLDTVVGAGFRSVMVLANKISDRVIGFVRTATQNPENLQILIVKTPGIRSDVRAAYLQDLAILTGGRPIVEAAGQSLTGLKAADLGQTRKAWANRLHSGIAGGKGDVSQLRHHVYALRSGLEKTTDKEQHARLQERLGKLLGGTATFRVGGATKSEAAMRKEVATRTVATLRGAVEDGVIPGGGVSLLACREPLQQALSLSTCVEERAAYQILLNSIEVPIRTLLANAGYDAGEVLAEIKVAGPGYGFDINQQVIRPMGDAGIYDVSSVQKAAIHSAVSTAALALSMDVLVHHRNPKESFTTA